jgi:hypothetical protein
MHVDLTHELTHELTPPDLNLLNQKIGDILLTLPIDDVELQQIIVDRANLVESLLNTLDPLQQKRFAQHELKSNDAILAAVDIHRKAISIELAKVNKASKAIKKYHQV